MNIDNIAVVLRLRSHWQAIDLGFKMARHWFWRLWLLWLLSALPVLVVASFLLHESQEALGMLIWWLKPLYEAPLLFFLSRAMFGENLSIREIAKNYFPIVKVQLAQVLTIRRLSLSRSFNNPVHLLEGLKGIERKSRIGVLQADVANTSHWMLMICVQFELLLYISIVLAVGFFIPADIYRFELLFFNEEPGAVGFLAVFMYFVSMSLVAPFYTAAGFCLYLSRRTRLEAWDIELNFKRMNSRIERVQSLKTVLLISTVCFTAMFSSEPALCDDSETATVVMARVLAGDDFGKTKVAKVWRLKSQPEPEPVKEPSWEWPEFIKSFFSGFRAAANGLSMFLSSAAGVLQAILWISIILMALLLITYFRPWFKWQLQSLRNAEKPKRKAALVLGLDVSDESLAGDVIGEVQLLLEQNNLRAALSLLYRATLARLINVHHLAISESFTEGQCLALVTSSRGVAESRYFEALTDCWRHLAYAHRLPAIEVVRALCADWPVHYGALDNHE